MNKLLIILIASLLFLACGKNEKPTKPDNLIPKDKMENILYDLYVINSAKGVNRKVMEQNGFMPETYLLTKHKIDSAQFADSNSYYAFYIESYKEMVENVKTRLEKNKKELEKQQKIEVKETRKKKDSLNKVKQKRKDSLQNLNKQKVLLDSIKVL